MYNIESAWDENIPVFLLAYSHDLAKKIPLDDIVHRAAIDQRLKPMSCCLSYDKRFLIFTEYTKIPEIISLIRSLWRSLAYQFDPIQSTGFNTGKELYVFGCYHLEKVRTPNKYIYSLGDVVKQCKGIDSICPLTLQKAIAASSDSLPL